MELSPLKLMLFAPAFQEAPEWVQDLIRSHLVEEVPKFSKFIHGVSTLLDNRVSLLPFWLPQMDKDIRKPRTQHLLHDSPRPNRFSTSPVDFPSKKRNAGKKRASEIEIIVDSNGSEIIDDQTPLLDDDALSGSSGVASSMTSTPQGRRKQKFPSAMFKWTGLGLFKKDKDLTSQELSQRMSVQQKKRIALPVRVEPKVFFANERTYLQWLHCTYRFVDDTSGPTSSTTHPHFPQISSLYNPRRPRSRSPQLWRPRRPNLRPHLHPHRLHVHDLRHVLVPVACPDDPEQSLRTLRRPSWPDSLGGCFVFRRLD